MVFFSNIPEFRDSNRWNECYICGRYYKLHHGLVKTTIFWLIGFYRTGQLLQFVFSTN